MPAAAQTPGHTAAPASLRQCIARIARHRDAPGAQYLAHRPGKPRWEHCHGSADVGEDRPVTPETTFNAYSITKVFTATAAISLANDGRLDLEAPIGEAAGVPGLEAYGTVRETLLHRAGFRNPMPLRWIHRALDHETFDQAAFLQARLSSLAGTSRRWSRSGYSNLGYLVLGLAIERAWGGPFVEALQALVLAPLAPRADERLDFRLEHPERHARGHLKARGLLDLALGWVADRESIVQRAANDWVQLHHHQVDGAAYGGLIANARGLARFGAAALGEGAHLSDGVIHRLNALAPGPGPRRSLGWSAGSLRGHPWLAHAGGGLAAYGELRIYPTLGATSVLLTNGPGLSDAHCLDQVDPLWIDETLTS